MAGWIVVGAAAALAGAAMGRRWMRHRRDQVLCHQRFEDWLREEQARHALMPDRA